MTEIQPFTNEEVKNLLTDIKVDSKIKQKYSDLFNLEKDIRDILSKRKMSKKSFDIILDILSGIRLSVVILTSEEKMGIEMKNGGFKSNTDFNYYRFLDEIEGIAESEIKKDILKIIKNIRLPLNNAEKEFRNIPKEAMKYGCKLICPYCENEYVKEFESEENKVEFVEKCPTCSKNYRVIAGKVILWRGIGTGVVTYGTPEYTARIKNENGEKIIFFNSNRNLLHIKRGDAVYFTFKKKTLSSQFSEKPFAILNATSNTYVVL